jgi:hypothetical protein
LPSTEKEILHAGWSFLGSGCQGAPVPSAAPPAAPVAFSSAAHHEVAVEPEHEGTPIAW